MRASIAFDRLRWEEKALKDAAEAMGVEASLVDAKTLTFEVTRASIPDFGDVVLQRCISHYRTLYLSRILESYGAHVINTYAVAELCGNKLATTMALARARVPTPRTYVALSAETAEHVAEELGFPLVIKPFTGSWGRMVSVVRDMQTLHSIVELREELPNPLEHMYYLQEYVRRPPRDIRAVVAGDDIVACVYRYAAEGDWRTNVARGGTSKAFSPDSELTELIHNAARAVGGGILGVDAMESPDGYRIHEVNNTVEFKGAQSAVDWSIPKRLMGYLTQTVRR
ncbi:MAG: lysine biosynthesis protein LysX [Nitrososphaerota archaeon]|nr:lysine biosynthesis protein LysX [Nitrososphaerota archaeon]